MGFIAIALIKVLALLNLSSAQSIGRFIGRQMYRRRTRSREVARVNLAQTYPQLEDSKREELLKGTLCENGMIAAEMGPMWGYSPAKILSMIGTVHDQEVLDQALADERPLLILIPHIGNWEILNGFLCQYTSLMAMYRPAKLTRFNQWMTERRRQTGITLVPTQRQGIEQLFSELKRGGTVAVLPDQVPKPAHGVYVPFMGVKTLTPVLPHKLIQDSGARVIIGFSQRLPYGAGFDIHFQNPDDDIYHPDAEVAMTAMNTAIARCVAIAPLQYQWTYKRFKRPPNDQIDPYTQANVP